MMGLVFGTGLKTYEPFSAQSSAFGVFAVIKLISFLAEQYFFQ